MKQAHAAWDALYFQTLNAFGEHEMARLFQWDAEQFARRYEAGRQFFHGTDRRKTTIPKTITGWTNFTTPWSAASRRIAPWGPMGLRS